MSTPRLLALCCAAALTFAASTASAQSAAVGASVETGAPSAMRDVSERFCLSQTGTRINTRARLAAADANAKAGAKVDRHHCALGPGRVYTRDDINMTGRVDLADALRALDPSIR